MVRTGRRLLKAAGSGRDDLVGIGIGLPGPVEHSTGRPAMPPIMPGWDHFDIPGHVSGALRGPVLVDNDVNVMALGEHATVYPHVEHLIFVKVATGIGAGIISGAGSPGGPRHGRRPRPRRGPPWRRHRVHVRQRRLPRGGRERSGRRAGAARARAWRPATAEAVRLVKHGDLVAAQAMREAGREIGSVLATCVSLLNPSVIAIGGLLAQSAEGLLAGIREVVYGRSLPLATGELQIVASRTAGHAGVIGAATMIVQHVLSAEQVEQQVAAAAG